MKKAIYWIIIGTVSILLIGSLILYFKIGNNPSEYLQLISGFSTFVVALLTATYVFTTTNQLTVMEKQLDEMKKGRELENQPFPLLENPKFIIERPQTYYTPPSGKADIHSLYHIDYKVKNIGKDIAFGVFIDPKFIVEYNNESFIDECVPRKLEIIEEGKYFESDKPTFDNYNKIFITGDTNFLTPKSLLKSKLDKLPKLQLTIYYKNFLGTAFKFTCFYDIYPYLDRFEESENTPIQKLKKWVSILTDAHVKYSISLRQIEEAYKLDSVKGHEKFLALKVEFEKMIEDSEQNDLEFPIIMQSSDFKLSTITNYEYESSIRHLLDDEQRRRYN
jgi:hypothetical protein